MKFRFDKAHTLDDVLTKITHRTGISLDDADGKSIRETVERSFKQFHSLCDINSSGQSQIANKIISNDIKINLIFSERPRSLLARIFGA